VLSTLLGYSGQATEWQVLAERGLTAFRRWDTRADIRIQAAVQVE
jgi:hypothetical protein